MGLTPDQMFEKVIGNLEARTGHGLEYWKAIVRAYGPGKFLERVERLKREHRIGHSTAGIIVAQADKPDDYVSPTDEELIACQYAGKESLLPIYERVAATARALGSDVELSARNTYVSMIRRRQFGIIQPSTKTRVDVGLKLRGVEPTIRLQAAGSFGSGGVTHRVSISSPKEVDPELIAWVKQAYEGAK